MLTRTYRLLSRKNKFRFLALIVMMSISAVMEIIGIAVIIPFMGLISGTEINDQSIIVLFINKLFNIEASKIGLNYFALITGAIIVFSLLVRGITMFCILNFTQFQIAELSEKLFRKYINQDYSWLLLRNKSELNNNILQESERLVNNALTPIMLIFTHSITGIGIFIFLLFLSFKVTLISGFILSIIFFLTYLLGKKTLYETGKIRFLKNQTRYKISENSINNFKPIKFEGVENYFFIRFKEATYLYAKALAKSVIIAQIPRYFIEGITFLGIIIISIILVQKNGSFQEASPILAAIALSGLKLLPSLQQIYHNSSLLKSAEASLTVISNELDQNQTSQKTNKSYLSAFFESEEGIKLKKPKDIKLKNICFYYKDNPQKILNNINLNLNNNQTLGIIGMSGAGKSTLISIILGLLKPQNGILMIDDRQKSQLSLSFWRDSISYSPQFTSIFPGTVSENIAFGKEQSDIDLDRIKKVCRIAEIYDFINTELKQGFDTWIGDGQLELSGGQIQRIGIARALYKRSNLLILDESTSALDTLTEAKIIKNISSMNYSIGKIIVSHRLDSLKTANKIIFLKNGKIMDAGNYQELSKRNELFNNRK